MNGFMCIIVYDSKWLFLSELISVIDHYKICIYRMTSHIQVVNNLKIKCNTMMDDGVIGKYFKHSEKVESYVFVMQNTFKITNIQIKYTNRFERVN